MLLQYKCATQRKPDACFKAGLKIISLLLLRFYICGRDGAGFIAKTVADVCEHIGNLLVFKIVWGGILFE